MVAIGVDFGTTNSIISYYESGQPLVYMPTSAQGTPQVRSAILLEEQHPSRSAIGLAAFLRRGKRGVRLFDRFKMMIGTADEAEVAAKAFLNGLLDGFKADHGVADIESVVITVPDQWLRSDGQVSYRALLKICQELKLPVRKILSEPVAAASFVSFVLKERGTPFDGHALVYDHGGGTLDLSLVKITGTDITTIDGAGIAPSQGAVGVGGLEFDRVVFAHLRETYPDMDTMSEAEVMSWMDEFERCKITLAVDIVDAISGYEDASDKSRFDDPIFEVMGHPVRPSDLVAVFEGQFAPRITAALDDFHVRHKEKIGQQSASKIITVGGFSNFYLVRKLVERVLARTGPQDSRFDTGLGKNDISFAIAKGACLFSANETQLFESCPLDVSVWLFDKAGNRTLEPMLKRGTPLAEIGKPVFAPVRIVAPNRTELGETKIELVFGSGLARNEITTRFSVAEALPNLQVTAAWQMGAYVGEDLVVHIVFETDDRNRTRKDLVIGQILEISRTQKAKNGR